MQQNELPGGVGDIYTQPNQFGIFDQFQHAPVEGTGIGAGLMAEYPVSYDDYGNEVVSVPPLETIFEETDDSQTPQQTTEKYTPPPIDKRQDANTFLRNLQKK